ncbi:hypothetical protein [Gordonia sp. SND2]|uniref:hypothetical protein n=1 Tax=Gordonia sp. SND2 TaxID=3388659 RepID=UPI00398AB948
MTSNPAPEPGQQIGLADIIGLLGHRRWTSIMQKEVHATRVRNHHVTPGIVPALVGALAPSDVWYGVNEITEPPADNRRATENTVARWCAVWADLDVKPGGCPTEDIANHIIDDISNAYGTRPTYIVVSGHGLQPVWVIAHNDTTATLDDDQKRAAAVALLKRHGRMVQAFAIARNAKADSVFDLPRVLRAPDTTNHKDPTNPKPTAAVRDAGTPLTVAGIAAALDTADIPEMPSDTMIRGTVVAAPSAWKYRPTGQQRCHYAEDMIDGWATDQPAARHPWLVAQATRIAAARRHGCLSAADAGAAERELAGRFIALCQRAGDARPVGRAEIDSALRYGTELVATMTDQRVADELGKHQHRDYAAEAIELARMAGDLDQLAQRPAPTPTPTTGTPSDNPEEPFHPEVTPPTPAAGEMTVDEYTALLESIEGDFWAARPSLALIRAAALAETAAPWAVLTTVLMRVLAAVPHDVYLPGLGGPNSSPGSLNLYGGIVSKPSGGKGTAAKVAARLYPHPAIFEAGAGSGEGIGHLFGATVLDKETKTTEFRWSRRSVLLDIAEVDTLTAMTRRESSTIDSVLRQAFSGESIMFSYATVEKRLRLPAGEYRLCGVVHVQPQRASGLFAGADGGTPQRFIWAAASDPRIGAAVDYDGRTLTHDDTGTYRPEWWGNGQIIDVCTEALDEIRAERLRRARDFTFVDNPDDTDQALGGHTMYAREKVAAALAILDGRENINPDDWALSGTVIAMSNHTRDRLIEAMEIGRLAAAERRGMEKGAEKIGAKATETDIDVERFSDTTRWALGRLDSLGGDATFREIYQTCSKPRRAYLKRALIELEDRGLIESREVQTTSKGGRPGVAYRRA